MEDCQNRVLAAWKEIIEDARKADDYPETCQSLVVAHANTLRALVMHIDEIPSGEIENLNIPTGIPFYYDVCKSTGSVLNDEHECDSIGLMGRFRGVYISDDRKRRNFLERRRSANDPWLWALHDEQVARSMLVEGDTESGDDNVPDPDELSQMVAEASENTNIFSNLKYGDR